MNREVHVRIWERPEVRSPPGDSTELTGSGTAESERPLLVQ